jgi:TonB-linked SusC/RagA family outer membrane protein
MNNKTINQKAHIIYALFQKIPIAMRMTFLLLFVLTFQLQAERIYSQKTKISLNLENSTVEKVLQTIEEKSDYYFLYNNRLIDVDRKVSVRVRNTSISDVLDELFESENVYYEVKESQIILSPKDMYSQISAVINAVQQQKKNITGTIVDAAGEPIIGANVIEVGTLNGTVTDMDGKFLLSVEDNATVRVTYIGYLEQDISTVGRNSFNIILQEDTQALEEVVVVGYGVQKKANLTGAVDQIGEEGLRNRAITNVSQGLQGVLPNLNITFTDGKPTRSPSYNIRGTTSIGQGGSALILIDGIEGDPSLLNPNDIESVSILKDAASAAIYGSRGTFGVVLINTKSAKKNVTTITYSSNYSLKKQTSKNDYVTDGFLWASMFNEAFSAWNDYSATPQNVNKSMKFSLDYLDELERRSKDPSLPKTEIDPATGEYVYYHNTDWYDLLYKDVMFAHEQNLSLTGSTEKTSYYVTGRYVNQPGIFRYNSDDFNSYNFRAKGSIQLLPWLNVQNNTSYSQVIYFNPIGSNESNIWRGIQYDAPPMAPMFNPDGTLTHAAAFSVGGFWYGKNGIESNRRSFSNTTNFSANIYQDKLLLKGDFSFNSIEFNQTTLRLPTPYSRFENKVEMVGAGRNDIQEATSTRNYIALNLYGEYENYWDKHYLKFLLGGNYESSISEGLNASRNGLVWEGTKNINLALGQSISTSGSWSEWKILGGFFRMNYSFDNKYLVEVNGRYDGSSKFPSSQRYAFFPSISAGWRLSEESFWTVPDKIISDLKIRASYGSLGNGNINPYVFNESFGIARSGKILNGVRPQYTNQPAVLPAGLTWETSTTTNVGVDMFFADQRLSVIGDAYIRKTTDMFTDGVTLPAVFGASSPRGNYADLETKGWELTIGWRDRFDFKSKPFNYSIRFGVSDYISTILKFNNPEKRLNNYYVGQRIGEMWGLVTEGFFKSEEEIENSAKQNLFPASATASLLPGDIKFKDLNNDGVINIGDNTVDSPGDKKIIGNSEPRYRFGVNLDADWNNFFFSAFFQGIMKQDWYPDNNSGPFWGQYVAQYADIPKFQLGNIWSEDNPDAYFPRYKAYVALSSSRSVGVIQTKYIQNAAYVRLKNVQLGYNLPKSINSLIKAEEVQFYLSGENLWTYSPFYKLTKGHIDVENIRNADPDLSASGGGGHAYPILKSMTLGVKIAF